MNLGSDPADQIVRYTLEGTEVALKLSGLAAKNFALFVYAVLKDQKKTRGKTRLVRMLKEQRPFKFFQIPQKVLREFAKEARAHGLLYVPIRNKHQQGEIELVVFADDAAKVQRVLDNLNLDFVKAQAGEALVEPAAPLPSQPIQTEQVQTEAGPVEFQMEDEFNAPEQEDGPNFTPGRESPGGTAREKSPSGTSSPGRKPSPSSGETRPSVRKELRDIRKELQEKPAAKAPVPHRAKEKQKGR